MAEPRKSRWLAWLLLGGVLLVGFAAVTLVGLTIASHRRPSGPVNVALRSQLIGTWAGDHGVVLEFKSDGTGSSRTTAGRGAVSHWIWTVTDNELTVYLDSQNRINRYVFNQPASSQEIADITNDKLELVDRSLRGKVFHMRFKKKNDAAQGSAP
jgi:Tfp pilus assembly protein PilN